MLSDGIIVAERFRLLECIGEGAFGEIFSATKSEVAVKLEVAGRKRSPLKTEAAVYQMLQKDVGFPKLYWSGSEGDYNVMVMELLGHSLEELMQMCGQRFSIATSFSLAQQMLDRIEAVHSKGLLHRDIKPDNYVMGLHKTRNTVYLIDFGLTKRYINAKSRTHIPFNDKKKMVGTLRYCSLNSQMGCEQSRRDDLESLGYCLVYMLKGTLPWQGMKGTNKRAKHDRIFEKKVDTAIGELCQQLPIEVARYMYYCRNLKFDEEPDYALLRGLLRAVSKRTCCFKGFEYDWNTMRCDLTKRTRRESNDSNKAECEEQDKMAHRKMSRKIEIQNLASGLTPRSNIYQKRESKERTVFNPFFDSAGEEQKVSHRSIPRAVQSGLETKEEAEKSQPVKEPYSPNCIDQEEKSVKVEKSRAKSNEVFMTPTKDQSLFLEGINLLERTPDTKAIDTDRSSCNFRAPEITERTTIYDDSIPIERTFKDYRVPPNSAYIHSSTPVLHRTKVMYTSFIKRCGTHCSPMRYGSPFGFRKVQSNFNDS